MRVSTALLTAAAASAVAILVSACSSAPPSSSAWPLPAGAASNFLGRAGDPYAGARRVRPPNVPRLLYVSNLGGNTVYVLRYGKWRQRGTITDGISSAYKLWVDNNKNLYVANSSGQSITEYGSSGNLIFTYSAGIRAPQALTTDKFANVYEGDFSNTINEYLQGSNSPTASCSLSGSNNGGVNGVAVDKLGDVFADYYTAGGTAGNIEEFPRGLHASGCNGTVLPVTLTGSGGIAVDRQGNLVVCDAAGAAVDIIAPPYTSITGTLGSGWQFPFSVTIDRAGTQAYVADYSAVNIQVLNYPGGSNVATIGAGSGSAVDSDNYVP